MCKVNSGLLAIAASLVLARCAGIADKTLIGYFNNSLFLILLGVMLIFCIAQQNKTLELLAKKVLVLIKGRVQLFPPLLFLFSAVLSGIGPGLISVCALMAVLVADEGASLKMVPWSTLIPTVPDMVASFGGGNSVEVVVALCVGAHLAALSPLSSCGGLMLAGYSSSGDVDVKARNKMFLQLFILSACGVLFCALLGLVGFYTIL